MKVTGQTKFAKGKCYRVDVIIKVTLCAEASKITKFSLRKLNYPKEYTFKAPLHEEATKIKMFCKEMAVNLLKQYLRIEMWRIMLLKMTRKLSNILPLITKEIQNQRYFHRSIKKSYMLVAI